VPHIHRSWHLRGQRCRVAYKAFPSALKGFFVCFKRLDKPLQWTLFLLFFFWKITITPVRRLYHLPGRCINCHHWPNSFTFCSRFAPDWVLKKNKHRDIVDPLGAIKMLAETFLIVLWRTVKWEFLLHFFIVCFGMFHCVPVHNKVLQSIYFLIHCISTSSDPVNSSKNPGVAHNIRSGTVWQCTSTDTTRK